MTARQRAFATIATEGGLLSSELLARLVDRGDARAALRGLRIEDYHLAPGERLNECITRSWNRLTGAWKSFELALAAAPASDATATSLTRERWSLIVFSELGYGRLQGAKPIEAGAKAYPVSHAWGSVPIHLVGARVDLDHRRPGVRGAAGASPHSLVQECLNRSEDHLWAMVCNGTHLRLLRDSVSLTRSAYVEFDLAAMMGDEAFDDFVIFWLACHQSRFEGDPTTCWAERWWAEAAVEGTRALETLRRGVEAAIGALGTGFIAHPANHALRDALEDGRLGALDYYRQLLRAVYRLIFVFVAEDRDLLLSPDANEIARRRYAEYYSLGRLRRIAETTRGTGHGDLWQGLSVVLRALGNPDGEAALGLPALGSALFSPDATPELDRASLANRDLLGAIRSLASTGSEKEGVSRQVDYRNLDAEELGSVYEALLEQHPEVNLAARRFALATAAGNERKTTGSYYTPTSLILALLDSALGPVLDEAAAAADPEAAILGLAVLDPACGSGHFLIAAAHRIARRLAGVRTGEETPAPEPTRTALRDVIGHCLYGVDVNPMAVELCKVACWMESLEPGKPLGFLDHRIVCGNSLLGTTPALLAAGIPDEAFKVLVGDDKAVVASLKKRNRVERAGQSVLSLDQRTSSATSPFVSAFAALDALPEDDWSQVTEKQRRFGELAASPETAHATLVADAWCAAFVMPKRVDTPVLTQLVFSRLRAGPSGLSPGLAEVIGEAKDRYGFLHPHLAFPTVDQRGGFDVVLGNPPWEQTQLEEKQFFAARAPEIANAAGARRKRLIAELATEDPPLFAEYLAALREADGVSHLARSSGRYPLTGRRRINTYALFAEAMRDAVGPTGRAGVIVPTGIATDDTTRHFFADLVEQSSLVSLFDFENRQGLFPAVDSRMKFCLLTLTGHERPARSGADFVFFAHQVGDLADPERRFTLSAADLELLNPNTRTAPVFRSARDAELTKAIYRRVPVLIAEGPPERNPWGISFRQGLFNMTSDSHLFRTAADLEAEGATLTGNTYEAPDARRWLPLYEAKMVDFYDHRAADVVISPTAKARQRQPSYLSPAEHADLTRLAMPQSWVSEAEVDTRLPDLRGWLLGFCDVTSSTNERTVIPAVIPMAAVGHTLPLVFSAGSASKLVLLGASLASLAFDFASRQKVATNHLTFFVLDQLPVLPPETYDQRTPWDLDRRLEDWVLDRVLELTYTAWDLEGFALDLGYDGPPFRWNDQRRTLLRAELDACFFHLYGIERDNVGYICDTFPILVRKDIAT